MLNFVLCDDNLNITNKLEQILETIFSNNNYDGKVVFKSDNADDILQYANSNEVDVLMLDIHLNSNKTGLELAEEIRKKRKNTYIIFTTGHLEYAMIAYKYKTFDYLPKPITYERLEGTIRRLFEDANELNKNYIKIDNKNTLIDEDEIKYIKKDGMKLVFHTSNCDYNTYSSFNKFQEKLPDNYIRCHKSYIANLNQIKKVEPVSNTITFNDDRTCEIGPNYKKDFMEVLKNYGIL